MGDVCLFVCVFVVFFFFSLCSYCFSIVCVGFIGGVGRGAGNGVLT